jgi:hypothetical protein
MLKQALITGKERTKAGMINLYPALFNLINFLVEKNLLKALK